METFKIDLDCYVKSIKRHYTSTKKNARSLTSGAAHSALTSMALPPTSKPKDILTISANQFSPSAASSIWFLIE
jgi:hypothetical protein